MTPGMSDCLLRRLSCPDSSMPTFSSSLMRVSGRWSGPVSTRSTSSTSSLRLGPRRRRWCHHRCGPGRCRLPDAVPPGRASRSRVYCCGSKMSTARRSAARCGSSKHRSRADHNPALRVWRHKSRRLRCRRTGLDPPPRAASGRRSLVLLSLLQPVITFRLLSRLCSMFAT